MEHPGATLKQQFLDPIGLTPYGLAKAQTALGRVREARELLSIRDSSSGAPLSS